MLKLLELTVRLIGLCTFYLSMSVSMPWCLSWVSFRALPLKKNWFQFVTGPRASAQSVLLKKRLFFTANGPRPCCILIYSKVLPCRCICSHGEKKTGGYCNNRGIHYALISIAFEIPNFAEFAKILLYPLSQMKMVVICFTSLH